MCLERVKPTVEQLKVVKEVSDIMTQEAHIEVEYFWSKRGGPLSLVVDSIGDYFNLAGQAVLLQAKRSHKGRDQRSNRLIEKINNMAALCDSGEIKNGINFDDFLMNLRPVAFTLFEDEFADMLASLDDKVFRLYDETSTRLRSLLKKM